MSDTDKGKDNVLRNITQNIIMTGFALKRRKVLNRWTAVPLEPPAFPGNELILCFEEYHSKHNHDGLRP